MARPRIRRHDVARQGRSSGQRAPSHRRRAARQRASRGGAPGEATRIARVLEVTPTGYGLAALEGGERAFVGGVIDGEAVRIRLDPRSGRVQRGWLVEVLEPSPERRVPACPLVDRCGGCDLMHLSEEATERLRLRHVEQTLGSAGLGDALPSPRLHRPSARLAYRSRARLSIEGDRGRCRVGYRGARSHQVVEVETCLVLREELRRAPADLAQLLADSTGRGQAQIGLGADGVPTAEVRWEGELAGTVFGRAAALVRSGTWAGIQLWPDGAREPARYGDPRPVLVGFDGEPLRMAAGGFAQPSDEGGAALARRVAELVDPGDVVVELFAGSGTLSTALAARAERLMAVESWAAAAAALRDNLGHRQLDARVVAADANECRIPGSTTAVVLDPPRAGARGAIQRMLDARPRRVIYVSCHLAALARDVADLIRGGYRIDTIDVFDLFPQTRHFETVLRLVR